MRTHRDRDWDKGVYQIDLKPHERLILKSPNGELIVELRESDLNLFTVTEGPLTGPFHLPDYNRIEIGSIVKGKYVKKA